jgi:hypothetical protein
MSPSHHTWKLAALAAMLATPCQATDEMRYDLPSPLIFEPVDQSILATEQALKEGRLTPEFVDYCKQYPDDCAD